nr:hypothetical protein [Frankia sp. QA3]
MNPVEAQLDPLRTFGMGNSDHPNHPTLARKLQAYLRRRIANSRHPTVLQAQRRERARARAERQQRWGRPRTQAAHAGATQGRWRVAGQQVGEVALAQRRAQRSLGRPVVQGEAPSPYRTTADSVRVI